MKTHLLVQIYAPGDLDYLEKAKPAGTVILLHTSGGHLDSTGKWAIALALLPAGSWIQPPLELRSLSASDVSTWSHRARRMGRVVTLEELGLNDEKSSGLPFSPDGGLPTTPFTIQKMAEGTPGFFLPPSCCELTLEERHLEVKVEGADKATVFVHGVKDGGSFDLRRLPQGLAFLTIRVPRKRVQLPSDMPSSVTVVCPPKWHGDREKGRSGQFLWTENYGPLSDGESLSDD